MEGYLPQMNKVYLRDLFHLPPLPNRGTPLPDITHFRREVKDGTLSFLGRGQVGGRIKPILDSNLLPDVVSHLKYTPCPQASSMTCHQF